jgi:hypothetical protein
MWPSETTLTLSLFLMRIAKKCGNPSKDVVFMVNQELLEERLSQIRTSVLRLIKMKTVSRDEFLANPDNFAVAEHHQRSMA